MSNSPDSRGARIAGRALGALFALAMAFAVIETGVTEYRAWRNKDGAIVHGYGFYEKGYTPPVVEEHMKKVRESFRPELQRHSYDPRGWELLDFHQWEALCRFAMSRKQSAWTRERERILARPRLDNDGRPLFTEADLPIERYRCEPMKMLYRTGQGWGFF
jgi:hypothetical protein